MFPALPLADSLVFRAAGITGFALNIGDPSESFVSDTLQYMFNYAPTVGFYLHISMDIWASGDADGGHPELYNDILQGYVAKSGYYQATAGMPFITTFSDGGLTADEWDAWKLSALANKLYFCPDFDGTAGYNTSATEWWCVQCPFYLSYHGHSLARRLICCAGTTGGTLSIAFSAGTRVGRLGRVTLALKVPDP